MWAFGDLDAVALTLEQLLHDAADDGIKRKTDLAEDDPLFLAFGLRLCH